MKNYLLSSPFSVSNTPITTALESLRNLGSLCYIGGLCRLVDVIQR